MSRPLITDGTAVGLSFARACVLDQRAASHARNDHSWDEQYQSALDSIDVIVKAHEKSKRSKP